MNKYMYKVKESDMASGKKEKLILCFSEGNFKNIAKKFDSEKEIPWVYLGQNFFKRRFIKSVLGGNFRLVNIAGLLSEVTSCIAKDHVEWIDGLNRRYGKKIWWWFGSISSRNIYDSNLFLYSAYLKMLSTLWRGKDNKPALVVVESPGLGRAILKWALKNNISVEVVNFRYAGLKAILKRFIPLGIWLHFLADIIARFIASNFSKIGVKRKEAINNDKPFVVIETFLLKNSILEDGTFKDSYYPHLHEYLEKKGEKVRVLPALFRCHRDYFSIFRSMRKSKTDFIIQEDYLKFGDYLSALILPLKFIFLRVKPNDFLGFDISDILKEEKISMLSFSGIHSVLIYRLFLRLAGINAKPKLIIEWYENQVNNKALILAVRKAFPGTKIAGAQLFIHSPNWLNLFPSKSELEAGLIPDILLETSQHQCKVAQIFTAFKCKPAAALRFAHLFSEEESIKSGLDNFKKREKILVLLSFSLSEAVELLEILKSSMKGMKEGASIFIKNHPNYSFEELIREFGEKNWPNNFKVFKGSLKNVMEEAKVVVSTYSSSMVEAIAGGIPVIIVGREASLNHNPFKGLETSLVKECFNSEELAKLINQFIDLPEDKVKDNLKLGFEFRDLFFERTNEKTLAPFLSAE